MIPPLLGASCGLPAYNNEEVWISGGVAITPLWKPYNVTADQWPVVMNENAVDGAHGAFVFANFTSWELVRIQLC